MRCGTYVHKRDHGNVQQHQCNFPFARAHRQYPLCSDLAFSGRSTEWMEWMSYRKWKETKQQPGTAGPGNIHGCCLVSLRLLCNIHSIHSVFSPMYVWRMYFTHLRTDVFFVNCICELVSFPLASPSSTWRVRTPLRNLASLPHSLSQPTVSSETPKFGRTRKLPPEGKNDHLADLCLKQTDRNSHFRKGRRKRERRAHRRYRPQLWAVTNFCNSDSAEAKSCQKYATFFPCLI